MEGTVKWFNKMKGYGFVQGEDGEEYFVHSSAIAQGTFIRENDRVSFEPGESDRGKQALNVTLLQKGSEIAEEEPKEEEPKEEEAKEEQPEEEVKKEAPKKKAKKKKAKKVKK